MPECVCVCVEGCWWYVFILSSSITDRCFRLFPSGVHCVNSVVVVVVVDEQGDREKKRGGQQKHPERVRLDQLTLCWRVCVCGCSQIELDDNRLTEGQQERYRKRKKTTHTHTYTYRRENAKIRTRCFMGRN